MQPHRCVFACMFGIRWRTSPCSYPSPSFLVFPMDVLRTVWHVPTLGIFAFSIPEIFGLGICWGGGEKEVSRSVPPPPLVLLEEETLRCVLTWTGTGLFDPVCFGCIFLCDILLFLRPIPSISPLFPLISSFYRRGSPSPSPPLCGRPRERQRREGGGGGGRRSLPRQQGSSRVGPVHVGLLSSPVRPCSLSGSG